MLRLQEALGFLKNPHGRVLGDNDHPVAVDNDDVPRRDGHSSALDQDVNFTVAGNRSNIRNESFADYGEFDLADLQQHRGKHRL